MTAEEVFAGYKPSIVSKHKAMNNVHLKAVIDRLAAAGDAEAADTIVWMVWWRELDRQREQFLIKDFHERIAEKIEESIA